MKIMTEKPNLILKELGTDPVPQKSFCNFSATFESKNIFLKGNYLKYSRGLSQTPWEIEGQKMVPSAHLV